MAGFARLQSGNIDRRLDAFGRFVERDLEVVAQVGPALRAAAATAAAKDIAESEHVAEVAEDIAKSAKMDGNRILRRPACEDTPAWPKRS